MRHPRLLLAFGLAAAAALAAPAARATDDAYRPLGDIPVQHEGRVKPLDTYARLEVKQVYGRETIKLRDAEGEVVARWEPLPALLDWSVRPNFWNEQDVLYMDYLPLKGLLLARQVRDAYSEAKATPPADPTKVTPDDMRALAEQKDLAPKTVARLKTLAAKLGSDHKWLSNDDLESAQIDVDGHEHLFVDWLGEIETKKRETQRATGEAKLTELEKKAYELGLRLDRYQSLRDRNAKGNPYYDLNLVPRPANAAYLKFTSEAVVKAAQAGRASMRTELDPLEIDAAATLNKYWDDLRTRDRKLPGASADLDPKAIAWIKANRAEWTPTAEFDAKFSEWLGNKAGWVPLRLLIESDEKELARAGFDPAKVSAFREAFAAVGEAERSQPGKAPAEAGSALLSASRALGESTKAPYPASEVMGRESFFNRLSPFYRAPWAYGTALVLLLVSLGLAAPAGTASAKIDRLLYGLGMSAFGAGIVLEIVGFYYRVRISGWAPVTNMYETVIWVGLVTAVIGLILEAIYRRKYAATAAAGVSLFCTLLAANVSLMDPDIKLLQPVLRSNYWLSIHVITIVSSYAAFALAMGLGLLAVMFYLGATYRRSPGYGELSFPLLMGLPLLAIGATGMVGAQLGWGGLSGTIASTLSVLLAYAGGIFSIVGLFGMLGEAANRTPGRLLAPGLVLLAAGGAGFFGLYLGRTPANWPTALNYPLCLTGVTAFGLALATLSRVGVLVRASSEAALHEAEALDDAAVAGESQQAAPAAAASAASGGVATLTRPTVAQIRARAAAAALPKLDPRSLAMQATAARIKFLANFVYRAMQVGVLLVAAGTILGGVWADVSWGRFWGWDPKEVWALITLLVYLVPLHGRFAGWVNTFGLICASVACFLSVLMAWYGVNFVLGVGLHSYGFTEGGGQGVVVTCCLAVLAVVGAAGWRRKLGYRVEAGVA